MIIRSTDQIKVANTNIVRQAMRGESWLTVAALMKSTKLSAPTIGRIIDEMLNAGEVLANPVELVTGGRRAKLYMLNALFSCTISVYIEKTIIWFSIDNVAEKNIEHGEIAVENFQHQELIVELVQKMLCKYPTLKAVSIGVPAWIHNNNIQSINEYNALSHVDFSELLMQKFQLPCRVTNDLNALVAGYYDKHYAKKEISMCGFYLSSSGAGAGMIINGKLLQGKSGFAGEVGSMLVHGVALNEFLKTSQDLNLKIQAIAKVVTAVVTICDVDVMLFCTYGDRLPNVEDIKNSCAKLLPGATMPEFVVCNDYHAYYLAGLSAIAEEIIASNR